MHPRKRLAFKNKARRAARQAQEPVVETPVVKTAPEVVGADTAVTAEPVKKVATKILPKKKKKPTSSVKTSS